MDKLYKLLINSLKTKISEVVDFAAFVLKKYEETILQKGVEKLVETSNAFTFLEDEEDLYTLDDLKERYR